jgi:hypothetical protein
MDEGKRDQDSVVAVVRDESAQHIGGFTETENWIWSKDSTYQEMSLSFRACYSKQREASGTLYLIRYTQEGRSIEQR